MTASVSVCNTCSFVQVLSDPDQRAIYDEINGFTLTSQNPFFNTTLERDQAFVDEFSCIGECLAVEGLD